MAQSALAHIVEYPDHPATLLKQLIAENEKQPNAGVTYMNLATIDDEFGVLNRTVLYRGLSADDCIIYVTQRYTRNYKNIVANSKCGITILFPHIELPSQGPKPATWQVRLIGATAEELPESELDGWWKKELLSSQIRNSIFPCGQPINYDELKTKHDEFLRKQLDSKDPLSRPSTYTAFKFRSQRWDFLKAGQGEIADRVQYRCKNDTWKAMHVAT